MLIEKEVARPGTYWYTDPASGMPHKAAFTPELLRYWHDQGNAMRAAGLSIPVPIEHQPTAKPMSAADKAAYNTANNGGWVEKYLFKKVKDDSGQEVDSLFSVVDIPDPELAKKLPHTIRWTSPWVSSFTDGDGKAWNGVISHLALTTRPRILKQQPFPSLEAAMSLAGNLSEEKPDPAKLTIPLGGFGFSRAGLLRNVNGKLAPAYAKAFALYSGLGFAADDVMDKEDLKKDKPAPTKDKEKPEEALADEDGDISIYEVIEDLLDAIGLPMGEGTTEGNFVQRLYETAMQKIKNEGGNGVEPPALEKPTNGKNNAAPLVQEAPPLYMSLEQANQITDPTLRSMALSVVQLQEENKASKKRQESLEKNAIERAKKIRQARIERLAKKLQPNAKTQLLAKAATAGFALSDNGVVVDEIAELLDIMEASVPELPELLRDINEALHEEQHPKQYEGKMSEERRQQVVAEACRNGGIRARVAAASRS